MFTIYSFFSAELQLIFNKWLFVNVLRSKRNENHRLLIYKLRLRLRFQQSVRKCVMFRCVGIYLF